jgi:hypothetical protein
MGCWYNAVTKMEYKLRSKLEAVFNTMANGINVIWTLNGIDSQMGVFDYGLFHFQLTKLGLCSICSLIASLQRVCLASGNDIV